MVSQNLKNGQSTTALFPRGGLKLHGAETRNIHERGLTETKWADQPIGVGAVKRYTSDYNSKSH
jgi:hypothetical protein